MQVSYFTRNVYETETVTSELRYIADLKANSLFKANFCLMKIMVPADKTTISSTGSLLRVFIYCFLSRIVEFDVMNSFLQKYIDMIMMMMMMMMMIIIIIIIIIENFLSRK